MFECLHRLAALKLLAKEERKFRKSQLKKLRLMRAPKSIIENEKTLVKRAEQLCSLLNVK